MVTSSNDMLLGFNVRVDVSPRIALYLARYNMIEAEGHLPQTKETLSDSNTRKRLN